MSFECYQRSEKGFGAFPQTSRLWEKGCKASQVAGLAANAMAVWVHDK
jgi:hypothetical protein